VTAVSNEDARFLERIHSGDEEALVRLFEANRTVIASYVTHNKGTEADARELLQEAVVILWERVRADRFEQTAKLSTFIYGVVKNLWLRRLARRRREVPLEIDPDVTPSDSASILDDMIEHEEAEEVRRAMQMIGETCRKLLHLFYWEERSMEEIAAAMGFANGDTAKAKKYQCKKALERALRNAS